MKLTGKLLWTVMLAASIFSSCSKKSDNSSGSTTNNTYVAPTLAKDTLIKVPPQMVTKASSDLNLALGVDEINFVNDFSSGLYTAFWYDQNTMNGWTSKKNSDGSVTYSWKYLQYSVWLTYYSSNGESWWKYGEDSASYSIPFYYIDDKGTSGETDWYEPVNFKGPSVLSSKDVWTKSNGTYNSTFNIYTSDGKTIESQYVSTSNSDKSGTLDVYQQSSSDPNKLVHQWHYVWDKNGSGSYTKYQDDGTTVDFTGTF